MRLPPELVEHIGYEVVRELLFVKAISVPSTEAGERCVTTAIQKNLATEAALESEAKRLLDANRALLTSLGGDYFNALMKIKAQLAKQNKFIL